MKTNFYKPIQLAKTIDEINELKNNFLSECKKRENHIRTAELLSNVTNFGAAQAMFESMIPSLLSKKQGKSLINKYTQIIKENSSLKTMYAYSEGLKENKTSDAKKTYITEALSIGNTVKHNEYAKGVGNLVKLISEAFKALGDEFVLSNVSLDNKASLIGESLLYLATTKKTVKNLNEYFSHIDRVSDNISENRVNSIDINQSLEEIVSEMKGKTSNIDSIFETEDKEKTFQQTKKMCLEMISNQKKNNNDSEIVTKLTEMEDKLSKKTYHYDSFTKDMLYMTELQEVLK